MSKKVIVRKKKKIALIILSAVGGLFATSLLLAAFICNSDGTSKLVDKAEAINQINENSTIPTYKSTFGEETNKPSHYVEKYDDAIEATHQKYVNYKSLNNLDDYVLSTKGDSYAVAYAEDFLLDLADQVEDYYNQIQLDRKEDLK